MIDLSKKIDVPLDVLVTANQKLRRKLQNQKPEPKFDPTIAQWLEECCEFGEDFKLKVGSDRDKLDTAFGNYYQFGKARGAEPPSKREFSAIALATIAGLSANIPIRKHRIGSGWFLFGIRLKESL